MKKKLVELAVSMEKQEAITNMVTVREALTTADANILIPKTIELVMMEAAEPEYLISKFFKKINLQEGRSIEIINTGAIRAFEVAEGQEYPEQSLDFTKFGGASTEVKVRKYGLKVRITDEMISDSQWDVIGMHLEAAGRAMARKKEELICKEFSSRGHIILDGDSSEAMYRPTGRGYDGTENGSLSAEDLLDMCTAIMAAGFNPTHVIMHPLCYSLFTQNKDLMGLMGKSAFNASAQVDLGFGPDQTSLAIGGLTVMFSSWVPFNEATKKYDMYVIDSANVGVIVQKDAMSTDQFSDPERDIQTLKVKERYGIGVLNGGMGIAVAKNIAFKKTYPIPERQWQEMTMPADLPEKMDEIKVSN